MVGVQYQRSRRTSYKLESGYNVTSSNPVRQAISKHNPALVFLLSSNVLRLTPVPEAPSVKPLESGLSYGIKLCEGKDLQDAAVLRALTDAIKEFVNKKGTTLLVLPKVDAAKRTRIFN
jgi:hypothetical protein